MVICMCVIVWYTGAVIFLDAYQYEKWHSLVRDTGFTELSHRQPADFLALILCENLGCII